MTVSSTTKRNDYEGTGSTDTYSYTFQVYAIGELRVTTRENASGAETELTPSTDFTATGIGSTGGGTITLTAGNLASGYHLTIRRQLDLLQETDYRNQGAYYPETVETALDRATMIALQQQDEINRSLKAAETDDTPPNNLPVATQRASKVLAFDADGHPEAVAFGAVFDDAELVDTLSALRGVTPTTGTRVYVKAHTSEGDGGHGWFRGVTGAAAGTYTDDNGITIVPTGGDGSAAFVREYSGPIFAGWFGVAGDGSVDDTAAIQAAIDAAGTSVDFKEAENGVEVHLGSGVFKVTNLVLKSGVSLIGEGRQATRLLATGTSGWTITTQAFTGLARSWETNIKRLSINGHTGLRVVTDATYTRPTVGGIGMYSSLGFNIEDVGVYFLDGVAAGFYTSQDGVITFLDMLHNDTGLELGRYDNDIANALHFLGCRSEHNTSYLLRIDGDPAQVRDINFNGCKFENGKIDIRSCNGVMFSGSSFVQSLVGQFMITIAAGATADTRGVVFDSSAFISGSDKDTKSINAAAGTSPVVVSNCVISSTAARSFTGDIIFENNTLYDVAAPYAYLGSAGRASNNVANAVSRPTVSATESGGIVSDVAYGDNIAETNLLDYTSGAYVSPDNVVNDVIYKNISGEDIVITARIRNLLSTGAAAAIQVQVGSTAGLGRSLQAFDLPSSEVRDFSVTFRVKAGWFFRLAATSPSAADVNGALIS